MSEEKLGLILLLSSLASASKFPSNRRSWGTFHLCPEENFSSQLKQSPCARPLCVSSQDGLLTGDVVVEVEGTDEVQVGGGGGRENSFCRWSCSSFMRAKLMASFKVFGLNIRIASEISGRNPPMNDPTSAFCDQP